MKEVNYTVLTNEQIALRYLENDPFRGYQRHHPAGAVREFPTFRTVPAPSHLRVPPGRKYP